MYYFRSLYVGAKLVNWKRGGLILNKFVGWSEREQFGWQAQIEVAAVCPAYGPLTCSLDCLSSTH